MSKGCPTTVPIAPAMPPAKRRLFCVDKVPSELDDRLADMEDTCLTMAGVLRCFLESEKIFLGTDQGPPGARRRGNQACLEG